MVMAKATTWVMVMVTRLAGNKEGKGEGSKGDADDDGDIITAAMVAIVAAVANATL